METLVGKYSEQVARFVARLPRIRQGRGMSQQRLADASGMDRRAIAKMEVGARGIALAEALALADALDVDLLDALSDKPLALNVTIPID